MRAKYIVIWLAAGMMLVLVSGAAMACGQSASSGSGMSQASRLLAESGYDSNESVGTGTIDESGKDGAVAAPDESGPVPSDSDRVEPHDGMGTGTMDDSGNTVPAPAIEPRPGYDDAQ